MQKCFYDVKFNIMMSMSIDLLPVQKKKAQPLEVPKSLFSFQKKNRIGGTIDEKNMFPVLIGFTMKQENE